MPPNSYVTLGRSGLRVSPFCLGAMTSGEHLPGFGASVEESEAVPVTNFLVNLPHTVVSIAAFLVANQG
jgi:hypothetical protein